MQNAQGEGFGIPDRIHLQDHHINSIESPKPFPKGEASL